MSNEVAIDLTLNGVGSLKSQLKQLKAAIAEASDPAQMDALAKKAGEVSDRIKDANDAVNVFASGSKFEQISSSFGGIKDSIMSLDFEEAATKAQTFQKVMGSIGKAEISTALKGIGKTVTTLGSTFMKLGAQILMNPIFLLAAVITLIVVAVVLFMKKLGILDDVLKVMMAPLNLLIAGFKELTDWLGITQFAAEENAEKMAAANKRVQESSKEREAVTNQMYSNQLALLKANGADTYKTEVQASMSKSLFARERYNSALTAYNAERALGKAADAAKLKDLRKQIADERAIIGNERVNRQVLAITDAKGDAAAAAAASKAAADKRKENAANRLAAERSIIDQRIALIKDETTREFKELKIKFQRQEEDIKLNDKLTDKQKAIKVALNLQQMVQAEVEFRDAKSKLANDAAKDLANKEKEINDKKKEEANERFVRLQELTLSESDFKIFQLEEEYEKEMKLAGDNAALKKALTAKLELDITDVEKKAAEDRIALKEEEEKKKRDAQLKTANDGLKLLRMESNQSKLLVILHSLTR